MKWKISKMNTNKNRGNKSGKMNQMKNRPNKQ